MAQRAWRVARSRTALACVNNKAIRAESEEHGAESVTLCAQSFALCA